MRLLTIKFTIPEDLSTTCCLCLSLQTADVSDHYPVELQLKTTFETDGAFVTTASSSKTTAKSSAVSSVRGGLLQDVLTQLLRLAQLTL